MWKALSAGVAAIAAVLTQHVMSAFWRRTRGAPPPTGPADRSVSLSEALTWAISMGVSIGVARFVAVRLSVRAWEAATHEEVPEA